MTEPNLQNPQSAAAWLDAITQTGTQAVLAQSGLPEAARLRLAAGRYATPAELQTAIDAERAYLASLAENGVVQIGGMPPRAPQSSGPTINGMRAPIDRIALALEALLSGTPTPAGI